MSGCVHRKLKGQRLCYGYVRAVEDRFPGVSGHDKRNWQDGAERCCRFIPRVVGSVVKGVHDVVGSLLSIMSVLILSMGQFLLFFFFFKDWGDLCRKLVVAIAV